MALHIYKLSKHSLTVLRMVILVFHGELTVLSPYWQIGYYDQGPKGSNSGFTIWKLRAVIMTL